MKDTRASLWRYFLIAAVLHVVWGLVPSASKRVLEELPVELYIALRWSISGTLFAVFLLIMRSRRPWRARGWARAAGLGVLGYGLASMGTLYGLKVGGVANFALLSALSPVVTSLVSIAFLRERPSRLFYAALPLCVLGLGLLVIGKYQVSSVTVALLSAALILGAYILEGLTFVGSKRLQDFLGVPEYLAVAQLSAAALMWLLQFFVLGQTDALARLTWTGLGAALFVSIVACVLCYAVLYWLLKFVEGHRLALFEGLHALSATVFGYVFFREPLTGRMVAGGALLLAGLLLGNLPPPELFPARERPRKRF